MHKIGKLIELTLETIEAVDQPRGGLPRGGLLPDLPELTPHEGAVLAGETGGFDRGYAVRKTENGPGAPSRVDSRDPDQGDEDGLGRAVHQSFCSRHDYKTVPPDRGVDNSRTQQAYYVL